MIYKDGNYADYGDLIRWSAWDSDDFVLWTFTGLFKGDHVIYLGGGIDFGNAIGKRLEIEDVMAEAEANDAELQGISKIGKAADASNAISKIGIDWNENPLQSKNNGIPCNMMREGSEKLCPDCNPRDAACPTCHDGTMPTELDELRKDAARYQFIRALENDAVAVQLVKSECDVELDDAIDAAIAQGKGE